MKQDSKYYDKIYKEKRARETLPIIFKKAIKFIEKKAIIDLGCGEGDLLKFLSRDNYYYGIDFSATAINIARKKWSKKSYTYFDIINIEEVGEKGDLPDIDIIVAIESLEHMRLPFVFRNIKKGQEMFISLPNYDSKGHVWYPMNYAHAKKILYPYIDIVEYEIIEYNKNEFYLIYGFSR